MIPSRKFASASILAAATLFSLPACAADIDGTFEAQRLRINQGLASGALTAREGDTLRAELTRIAVQIGRAHV